MCVYFFIFFIFFLLVRSFLLYMNLNVRSPIFTILLWFLGFHHKPPNISLWLWVFFFFLGNYYHERDFGSNSKWNIRWFLNKLLVTTELSWEVFLSIKWWKAINFVCLHAYGFLLGMHLEMYVVAPLIKGAFPSESIPKRILAKNINPSFDGVMYMNI